MFTAERQDRLLKLVTRQRFSSLSELAKQLAVSESTVRRDVGQLEQRGLARRIHGGVFCTAEAPSLAPLVDREPVQWEKKKLIAAAAARLIDDGDTLLLDGGSTTYELAKLLVGRPLHVVTPSLAVANLFGSDKNGDLVMIGGNICPRSGVARGPHANHMLSTVRVQKTIFSVAGISEEGFFNSDLLSVETERAMMRAANEVIVVADSTKFGRQSLTHLCPLDAVNCLVVDDAIGDPWRAKMEAAGVNLLVAGAKERSGKRSRLP